MQYADALLDRYKKVATLAERGDGGEQANASRQQAKLEEKYPGIGYQSQLRDKQREDRNYKGPGPFDVGSTERWKKWGAMAETAFTWATEVAGEVANLDYARRCALDLVEIKASNLSSAKHQIAVKIPLKSLYSVSHHLTPPQKQVFAQMIGSKVSQMVLEALEQD
tara:strand:+ start:203 stop:700 length:498 start_codon:yes stop_codon:yes gene_type:complete